MKKTLLFLALSFLPFCSPAIAQETSLTVFDNILFYDGYAGVVDFPTPEGVIRHRNDLYAKKLSEIELAAFGNTMTINVNIGAACDNYDRIGNVNLAFVPKGDPTYVPANVQRIELGRFITPFMNKNISPTEVPYTFSVDNVASIFKDAALLAAYDIWVEFEVFGVPYAAQTQVAGCAGQIDVFFGTLEFVSSAGDVPAAQNFLLPLNFKKDLNNYAVGATDVIGETTRTITFDLPVAVDNAVFYLITSSHGANAGGEEYNRRWHYIAVDDILMLSYRPGGVSCEPYRVFNTQANGIYGPNPRPLSQWQSFSNWCPGQVIPIRTIPMMGTLAAGTHTFWINVPSAVFVDQQGYIPVSLYLQGTTESLGVEGVAPLTYSLSPNPASDVVAIQSSQAVKSVAVFNMLGQQVLTGNQSEVNVSSLQTGLYTVNIEFVGNTFATQKLVKQ